MANYLVIVESPAKVKTIKKFLGANYVVDASNGHVRDMPKSQLGFDVANDYEPKYITIRGKGDILAKLRKEVKKADRIYLATDPDREGEAISWHLMKALKLDELKDKKVYRISFNEITKNAVKASLKAPRQIDMNLVDAQQARRVLDRLVGFELSPILWKKIQPKLSAGRVQSVALRLVVDREREIMNFHKEQYYKVEAVFHPEGTPGTVAVKATLDTRFPDMDSAEEYLRKCIGARFSIRSIDKKEGIRVPAAPFTTSSLQQEAARKLRFSVSQTMSIAQKLYEAGFITYMRTDSTNLSSLALGTAKKYISENFGEEYSKTRQYKTKAKGAQEAHEAIRPTYIEHTEIQGTPQEQKLYELIWKRTVASQMADAKVMKTDIKVGADKGTELFSIQATEVLFDGFLKLYIESQDEPQEEDEVMLPELHTGDVMEERGITAECKFTAPPMRYSEATLVKKLEELGIGRPSTYAPTISTLTKGRGYIIKGDKEGEKIPVTNLILENGTVSTVKKTEIVGAGKGRLLPQEIGMIVTDYLVDNFGRILDYGFTADVEKDFDQVAEGQMVWNELIAAFYGPFHQRVEKVLNDHQYSHVSRELGTDPQDGKPVIARYGQYGPYVQKGEGDDRQFASLAPGQLIESITLEEALKLFGLPRKVGQYNGMDIICTKGRFGPYMKYGDKNISLPRGSDPLNIDLDSCIRLIEQAADKKAGAVLLSFPQSDIQVIDGNYGPYIKHAGHNYRIPKGTDASALTEDDCNGIIASTKPTGRRTRKK